MSSIPNIASFHSKFSSHAMLLPTIYQVWDQPSISFVWGRENNYNHTIQWQRIMIVGENRVKITSCWLALTLCQVGKLTNKNIVELMTRWPTAKMNRGRLTNHVLGVMSFTCHLLAPSGALITIPTYYWPSTTPPTFSDHTGPQHWTFTFWATTAI